MFVNKTILYLLLLLISITAKGVDKAKADRLFYEIPDVGLFICTDGHTVSISRSLEALYDNSYASHGVNCNLEIKMSPGQIDLFVPKDDSGYVAVSDKSCVIEQIVSAATLLAIRLPNSLNEPKWKADYCRLRICAPDMTVELICEQHESELFNPMADSIVVNKLNPDKKIGYRDPDISILEKLFRDENRREEEPDVSIVKIENNQEAIVMVNGETLILRPAVIRDGLFGPSYLYPWLYISKDMPDLIFTNSYGFVSTKCSRYYIVDFPASAFNREVENLYRIIISRDL